MYTETDLHDNLIMITGATSGIGLAAAEELARLGNRLVLVGRNPEKGAATVAHLKRAGGNPPIDYLNADLSSQAEIRRLAEEFRSRYDRLDVLINNAGGSFMRRELTVDGIERTWALDHLSYFLLTNLLLDTIKASAPARIVNVASGAHRNARIHFEDLNLSQGYSLMRAYGQAKLANVLFTYELSRRLEGTQVTVNALHPGFTRTKIGQNDSWLMRMIMPLVLIRARPPEKGAETVVYLASSPAVAGVTGKYFQDKQAIPSYPDSYDEETSRRLWDVSAEMTGLLP